MVFAALLNAHSRLLLGDDLLILAPTNSAFLNLLDRIAPQTDNPLSAAASITQTLDRLINSPNLTRILAYHVIEKSVLESELGPSRMTTSGDTLDFTNFPFINDADPVSVPIRNYRQIKVLGGSIMFVTDVLLPAPLESMLPAAGAGSFGTPDMSNGNNGFPQNGSFPGFNRNETNPGIPAQTRQKSGRQAFPVGPDSANTSLPAVENGAPDIFSLIINSLTNTIFAEPFISNAELLASRTDMQIMGALVTAIPELNRAAMSAPLHILAPTDQAFLRLFSVLGSNIDLPEISLPSVNDPKFLSNLTDILKLTSAASEIWSSVNGLPGLGEILQYHIIPNATDYETLTEMSRRAPVGTVLQNYSLVFQPDSVIDGDPSRSDARRTATYPTLTGYVTVVDEVLTPFDTSVLGAIIDGAMRTASPTPSTKPTDDSSDEGVCFPADGTVHTRHGARKIGDILGGDEIWVNEQGEHSAVFMFTHKQISGEHTFVKVYTAAGHNITLTSSHYMHVEGWLLAAGEVRIGDVVRTISGESAVVRVERVRRIGLVAPHTVDGGLVVDGVIVSGYSRAVHPWIAHALLAPVRWFVTACGVVEPFGGLFYDGGGGFERLMPKGDAEYLWG